MMKMRGKVVSACYDGFGVIVICLYIFDDREILTQVYVAAMYFDSREKSQLYTNAAS
jgi:hypothetical protein